MRSELQILCVEELCNRDTSADCFVELPWLWVLNPHVEGRRTGSADCLDITEADFSRKTGLAKFIVTDKFVSCFKLADKWAPEAIASAEKGLSGDVKKFPRMLVSCASDYVFECLKICGQRFATIDDHSEFIKNGGCSELIDALAQS